MKKRGADLAWASGAASGTSWKQINTNTAGLAELIRNSGYLSYEDESVPSVGYNPNYYIDEDYQRAVHGQRLANTASEAGYSHPVNVVQGLLMGTADNRYTKTQSAALYGGRNENRVAEDASYNLKTNGVMLGVDSGFDAAKGGNWLAGVAFSSARSDIGVMNSNGDVDSYGAQFYLARRYDNGLFVDTQAQFNHFSNSADVRMLDGGKGHAEFSGNGYGLGMTLGYTWQDNGFFAEPYVKATGRTIDGAQYTLSNGMAVNSDDYRSMQGELGVNLGYTFAIDKGYLKPYIHLAGINEFADDNKARINNVTLNNSIDGAAFQIGAELKLNESISGYAGFDYTKGEEIERPWQATVGIGYSW